MAIVVCWAFLLSASEQVTSTQSETLLMKGIDLQKQAWSALSQLVSARAVFMHVWAHCGISVNDCPYVIATKKRSPISVNIFIIITAFLCCQLLWCGSRVVRSAFWLPATRRFAMRAEFFCVALVLLLAVVRGQNLRPIIGILAQPPDSSLFFEKAAPPNSFNNTQQIVASYVKWLESGGARIVPVFYNMSTSYMDEIFSNINGLLYTGGGQTLDPGHPFFKTAMYFFNLAVGANNKGDYFPLWGTCQGFQFLNIAASTVGNESALTAYNSWDFSWPLDFTPASKTSRMFGTAPSYIYDIFSSENVTMNWHHWGISPELYKMDSKLADFYNVLSLNTDLNGKQFVSAVEGKNMPFYATQFHPEWPVYEWDPTAAANHDTSSVFANGYLAHFFVSETRKNNHSFPNPTVEANTLIYNYNPEYTEMLTGDLQTYYW